MTDTLALASMVTILESAEGWTGRPKGILGQAHEIDGVHVKFSLEVVL